MIDDLSVPVSRPGTLHNAPHSFPAGRVCEFCDTILSRYNSLPWCRVCEPMARRMLNIYGDFVPRREFVDTGGRPQFRCHGCEDIYTLEYQWLTADQRFCVWCRPSHAKRSDALELAS